MRAVQSQIHGRGDGAHQLAVDGIFGPVTNGAVRAFQTLLGLSVDGIVGRQTWNHLVNGYLAAPDPQSSAKDVFNSWEAHNRDQAGKNAPHGCVVSCFREKMYELVRNVNRARPGGGGRRSVFRVARNAGSSR